MRTMVLGALIGGLLVAAGSALFGFAQAPAETYGSAAPGGLIAFTCPLGTGGQQLTIVDPVQQVVSIYHVDATTGELVLKSVRNIRWDMQMIEFNGASPLPREIRSLLEHN